MPDVMMRIWHGSRVVGVIIFADDGSGSWVGAPGGAHNATKPQVEIDPWEGMVMDHRSQRFSPVNWWEAEAHECECPDAEAHGMGCPDPEVHTCASG